MGNGPHAAWPLAQYQIDVLTLLTMKISATTTTKNNGKVKMENDEEWKKKTVSDAMVMNLARHDHSPYRV